MPADNSNRFPILMLECGVKALSLRKAQDAIRSKYGRDYHRNDQALQDAAALWGATLNQMPLNRIGVFEFLDDIVGLRAGRCEAIVKMAVAPNGLCAMETSHRLPLSGAGRAPSIWNPVAFFSLDDARTAGLSKHRKLFTAIAQKSGNEAAEAKAMLDLIEDAATSQLQLF